MPEVVITGVKENIARFENVIMKQVYNEAGENSTTTAQVIDEESGDVICECEAGEGGGGGDGGDSDITTAEVTIVNNLTGEGGILIQIPWLDPGATEPMQIPAMAAPVVRVENGAEVTVNAILYKGYAYCVINSQIVTVETTGDIDYSEQYSDAMISGECTILLNGK